MKPEIKNILWYVFLFITIPITSLDTFFPIAYDIIKLIAVGYMCIYIINKYIKDRNIDKFDIIMLINASVLMLISIIKGTITFKIAFIIITLFIIPVFLKEILKKDNKSLQALYYIYTTIIILNFITIFFRIPLDEYQKIFFIGGKNNISITIIPSMMVVHLYSLLRYKKLTRFNTILLIMCVISLIVSKSSTAIIIAMILIFTAIISKVKLKKIDMTLKKYVIIYLVMFIIIVIIFPMLKNTSLNTLFQQVFNKNLTFSQRDEIWKEAYSQIIKSPIIGYGIDNEIIFNYTNGLLDETHNMIIQVLLTGGIVFFIIFVMINYISASFLSEEKKTSKVVLLYLFLYFVIGLMEDMVFRYQLWMIFAIEYSIREICANYKQENAEERNILKEIYNKTIKKIH